MTPPAKNPPTKNPPDQYLARFTSTERWIHRSTTTLMSVCIATAAVLYIGVLSIIVGRRHLIENIHVYVGVTLPLPLLVGWYSTEFRRDVRSLNRFNQHDWTWLRSRTRRDGVIPVGKFNAGQKLNAAFVVGSILVMVGTGVVMRFGNTLPVAWRTGATFVHDWTAYAIVAVVVGHIWFAIKDPSARDGMRTGSVPRQWALREHAAWVATRDTDSKPDSAR